VQNNLTHAREKISVEEPTRYNYLEQAYDSIILWYINSLSKNSAWHY